MAIILIIKTEDGELSEVPVLDKITMGRSSSADYTIKDSKMSGSHCQFEVTPKNQVMFTDIGSTNGSYLNNNKITKTLVKVNDVIRIGNTIIKLDDKRLSVPERMAIGVAVIDNSNEKTLPVMSEKERKEIEQEEDKAYDRAEKSPKRKTIVLDKSIKAKKPAPEHFTGVDSVLDQDAPTGDTRLLKLDSGKKKK